MSNTYVLRPSRRGSKPKPFGHFGRRPQALTVSHGIDVYRVLSDKKEGRAIPSRGHRPHAPIAILHKVAPLTLSSRQQMLPALACEGLRLLKKGVER